MIDESIANSTTKSEQIIKREPLGSGYFVLTTKEFKFSLDSLLLADFSRLKGEKKVCDLCAGCGIVSILFSADGSRRETFAVEIQTPATKLLEQTAELNKLQNIHIINQDLNNLDKSFNSQFDLVACNPPYKQIGTGRVNITDSSLVARHEKCCTLSDIISVSSRLLKSNGRLILCQKPDRLCDILTLMREKKLEPKKIRFVQQRLDTKPWLVLIEGKKNAKPGLISESVLIIENENHEYTDEIKNLYNKFGFNS